MTPPGDLAALVPAGSPSDCQKLIPSTQIMPGEKRLAHAPTALKSLGSEDDGVASPDAIDGVNHRAEPCLPVELVQRSLTEEVGLHHLHRGDAAEHDSNLLVAKIWAIHGMQAFDGLFDQLRRESRRVSEIDGKRVGVGDRGVTDPKTTIRSVYRHPSGTTGSLS